MQYKWLRSICYSAQTVQMLQNRNSTFRYSMQTVFSATVHPAVPSVFTLFRGTVASLPCPLHGRGAGSHVTPSLSFFFISFSLTPSDHWTPLHPQPTARYAYVSRTYLTHRRRPSLCLSQTLAKTFPSPKQHVLYIPRASSLVSLRNPCQNSTVAHALDKPISLRRRLFTVETRHR